MFASLFPYSLSLITVVFVINYGIECFTYLVITYIHHSTHILFVYKLVLVLLKLGGSKHPFIIWNRIYEKKKKKKKHIFKFSIYENHHYRRAAAALLEITTIS